MYMGEERREGGREGEKVEKGEISSLGNRTIKQKA